MGGLTERDGDAAETAWLVCDYLRLQRDLGVLTVPRPPSPSRAPAGPPAAPTAAQGPLPPDWRQAGDLDTFARAIADCRGCGLCRGRTQVVFGAGPPDAEVMFVGEAPGAQEDREGLPFVGEAGQLLTRMIASIKLTREDVYIANVIKCRPPGNRDPEPGEVAACRPYLMRQIELVRPRVICALGRFAAQTLLDSAASMGRLRGRVYVVDGIKVVPTYHPSALLHNPQWKRPAWDDLKLLRFEYDGLQL